MKENIDLKVERMLIAVLARRFSSLQLLVIFIVKFADESLIIENSLPSHSAAGRATAEPKKAE